MHVLHITDSLHRGGYERMVVDLANALTRCDGCWKASVCVTRSGLDLADELADGVETLVLGRSSRFDIRSLWRLSRWIHGRGVDVLHVHGRSTLGLVCLGRALGLLRRPVLFHDHMPVPLDPPGPRWFPLARRWIDRYVGVYDEVAQWALGRGMPAERLEVIENGIDLRRLEAAPVDLRAELEVPDDVRILFMAGGLRPQKGLDLLLRAFSDLRPEPAVLLVVAGGSRRPDHVEACRRLADSPELRDRVVFLGERDDVPGLARGADFGVVPSRAESGPLVLIEFLAAGLPFVATRSGSVPHQLERRGLAGIVAPGDVAALRGALRQLFELEPQQARSRGEAGRAVLHEFDVRRRLSSWQQAYQLVAESR